MRHDLRYVLHIDRLGLEASAIHFSGDQRLRYSASIEERVKLFGGHGVESPRAFRDPMQEEFDAKDFNRDEEPTPEKHILAIKDAVSEAKTTGGVFDELVDATRACDEFDDPVWVDIAEWFSVWPFCYGARDGMIFLRRFNVVRFSLFEPIRVEIAPETAHFTSSRYGFDWHAAERFAAFGGSSPLRVFGAMSRSGNVYWIRPYYMKTWG